MIELTNHVLSFTFLLEMIIKLIGFGPKNYAKDILNIFDAIVVCISAVEIVLYYSIGSETAGALTVFRTLRIMRVFKLFRVLKSISLMMERVWDSMRDIFTFIVLMMIFAIVFIILGMQFFANTVYFDQDGNITTSDKGQPPEINFND